jgi:hypothetical protein
LVMRVDRVAPNHKRTIHEMTPNLTKQH